MTRIITKNLFSNLIITIIMITVSGCGGSSSSTQKQIEPVSPPPLTLTMTQELDRFINTHFPVNQSGLVVLLQQDDKISYQASRGMADIPKGLAVNVDTPFRLASVSKPFTATAVMQLIEKGQVSPEVSVREYLPELSASWQAITIEQLLTHQSGIPNFFTDAFINRAGGLSWLSNLDNQRLLDHFIAHPTLDFPPGERAEYSNTNYVLLAQIISRVSGESFKAYMADFIFRPIGMDRSYVIDATRIPFADEALNYGTSHQLYGVNIHFNGSSSQVSSASDLMRFANALSKGQIIQTTSLSTMTQSYGNIGDDGYGFGWAVKPHRSGSGNYFFHLGSNDSFKSLLLIAPEKNLNLVILSNGGDIAEQHSRQILSIMQKHIAF